MATDETTWNAVVGHDWAKELLRGAIRQGRFGHAYLFTGPEHVGKTTLARCMAQAINCMATTSEGRPCGRCRACQLIAADRHPDVRLVEPDLSGRGKRTLKIESIRTLQQDLSLAAYEARHKVAILTHFDAATIGAANAFLKTLEEPPGNVVLLLTATEAEAVLPTISSRCHIIALRPLPVATIEAALVTRWAAAKPEAKRLAHLADGRLGWAVRAQNNPSMLAVRHENLQLLQEVLGQGLVERFSSAEALANEPEDLPSVLRLWAGWWRDLALVAYGRILNAVVNIEHEAELQAFAEQWKPAEISAALESTETAVSQLRANANARLVMENLLLGYPDCDGG